MPDGLECPELFLKKQSEINQNADSPDTEKQDAENLHLEIQSIENKGQLNTYLSSMKEVNSKASAPPKKKTPSSKKKYAEAVTMTEEEYQKLTGQHTTAFEIVNNT